MSTLTRRNLRQALEKLGLTRDSAQKTVEAFFESITSALREGKKISIVGLGTWEWKTRPSRLARNPKTGKSVRLEGRKILVFKPSDLLRRKLNPKP